MRKKNIQKSEVLPVEILSEVLRCCQEIGSASTLLVLKEAQISSKEKEISKSIKEAVCDNFKISERALFKGTSNGNRTIALMFIYALHEIHLGYDITAMQNIYGHKYKRIWEYMNRYKSLSENNKVDIILLKRFNEINSKINKAKN